MLSLVIVPIGVIASFRRMKKLSQDLSIIEAALRTSSKLVIYCPFIIYALEVVLLVSGR